MFTSGYASTQAQAMPSRPYLTAKSNTTGITTPLRIEHHILTWNCPVHISRCDSNSFEDVKAEYTHSRRNGAITGNHLGPSSSGMNRSARHARPIITGNERTANSSVSNRKYRRSSSVRLCTSEKMPGTTRVTTEPISCSRKLLSAVANE